MEIKTWNDLWKYLCGSGQANNLLQFYCKNPNEVAKAFWNGVLTVLELEGKIDAETGTSIWNEIVNSK